MMENNSVLDGVKVVELSTFIAAPTCSRVLADWGAEVIKIEPPYGDPMRVMGSLVGMPTEDDENIAFDQQNSNKKGLFLDLKKEEGKEIIHKLLKDADIFITNNREASLKKMGLAYEDILKRYPKLVYGQILGYGEKGPDKDKPGFDYTSFFARGGMAGTLYQKGEAPINMVPGLGDHQTGVFLASGVCAALFKAGKTGKGEKVTVSLLHSGIFGLSHMIASAQYGNLYPIRREDNINPLLVLYRTKDERFVQMGAAEYNRSYERFCKAIGREDLIPVENYNSFENVKNNSSELVRILDIVFAEKTADEWVEIFKEYDIPCEKAMLWEEILDDEQVWANEILSEVECPNGKKRIAVNSPVKFKERKSLDFNIGPLPGEHTVEILKQCGYSDEEIDSFRLNGVVKF
jgi:cinnamoyl-CoA:phenyllactate CoA-transferase